MRKKVSPRLVSLIFGILVICFAIGFYILAWTEPTQIPPGGNVPAPLNTSINAQSKEGALIIGTNGALTTGLIVQYGNVGIGTTSPSTKLHVVGGMRVTGLASCNTIDTDANGNLVCGTDEGGAGGGDITDVNGGAGLLPDSCSSGACTLNVNTGATLTTGLEIVSDQVRLMDDGCVAGEVLKRNTANNGWECVSAFWQCTTRTASGSSNYLNPITASCNSDEVITGGGCLGDPAGGMGAFGWRNFYISGNSFLCTMGGSTFVTVTAYARCCK